MNNPRFLTCLLTLLLFACASKNFNEPGVISTSEKGTEKSYSGSYADVWRASLAALSAKKFAVASSQRETGMIITDWVMGKSDRLYSGYGETRIPYNVRFKFTVRLKPGRSGVHMSVNNEEQYLSDAVTAGTDFSGSLYQWLPTESSTAKEAAFLEEVGTQLNALRNAPK